MKKFGLGIAAITLLLQCQGAFSGEFRVEGKSFPPLDKELKVELSSADLELKDNTKSRWTFSFKEKKALATLEVNAQASGYDNFGMSFEIPYYWDGPRPREIVGAVAKDEATYDGINSFYASARTMRGDLDQVTMVHQRAKRLWIVRFKQLSGPGIVVTNIDDVKIAYYLAASMRQLVERQGAVVDDESNEAATWLETAIIENPDLFNTRTAPAEDVSRIVSFLRSRNAYIYNRVIQQLEIDVNRNLPALCERVKDLNNFLFSMPLEDRGEYDGQFGNSIKVKDNLLICIRKQIAPNGPILSDVAPGDMQSAKSEVDLAQSILDEADQSDRIPGPRGLLRSRIADMRSLLVDFESRRTQ